MKQGCLVSRIARFIRAAEFLERNIEPLKSDLRKEEQKTRKRGEYRCAQIIVGIVVKSSTLSIAEKQEVAIVTWNRMMVLLSSACLLEAGKITFLFLSPR